MLTPPYGSLCKYNGGNLLIIGLPPETYLYFRGNDATNRKQGMSNDQGKITLTGIDFYATFEGMSAGLFVRNDDFSYEEVLTDQLDLTPDCIYI